MCARLPPNDLHPPDCSIALTTPLTSTALTSILCCLWQGGNTWLRARRGSPAAARKAHAVIRHRHSAEYHRHLSRSSAIFCALHSATPVRRERAASSCHPQPPATLLGQLPNRVRGVPLCAQSPGSSTGLELGRMVDGGWPSGIVFDCGSRKIVLGFSRGRRRTPLAHGAPGTVYRCQNERPSTIFLEPEGAI